MNSGLDPKNTKLTPSGEGERRAQRGYVPQYDLGARVIYEAMAAGRLQWIGLADRNAGTFDDLVLGLRDRIVAYQLKTSRDPIPFSIRTILLEAKDLLGRMLEARRKLHRDFPESPIETVFACDDYPRTDDNICSGCGSRAISSAAFIRAHEAHRMSWTLSDWRASPFAAFVLDIQAASQLDDQQFEAAWRNTRFLVGGQHRSLGLGNYNATDDRRLRDIAALLPRLVADPIDRDRWSVSEILSKLAWRDPFALRHGHAFPVDALYQSNGPTQAALQRALSTATSAFSRKLSKPLASVNALMAPKLCRGGAPSFRRQSPEKAQKTPFSRCETGKSFLPPSTVRVAIAPGAQCGHLLALPLAATMTRRRISSIMLPRLETMN
jgi:hypothetical protein